MSTAYRASIDGPSVEINTDKQSLLVCIWDLGPHAPVIPAKPSLPEGKEGSPAYDLALIDFNAELAAYKNALAAYGQAVKDFTEWHKVYAGPYEFETHSVNAREALANDPERYVAELPKGRKPGKWHAEEQQRRKDLQRNFAQIVARDPVFGNQGAVQ